MPHLGSDRICVIKLIINGTLPCYIIAVYLPHQGCKISNFQSELNILETTINDCIVDGEVLIIGDMNCHFGEEYGIRGSGKSYGNSRCLMRMIAGYNMQMADIGEKGMGLKYSFYSALHKTYLDHCAVSEDLYNIVDRCEIIPDDINNVSDHLAIRVVINVPQPQLRNSEARHQVGWEKATPDEIMQFYTLPLEAEIVKLLDKYDINRAMILENQTSGKLQNVRDLERIVDQLASHVIDNGKNLPAVKFNRAVKPYWNKSLSSLSTEKKNARAAWVLAGRPSDPDNLLYRQYKEVKRSFRREQRSSTYTYEKQCMEEIGRMQDIDQKLFWCLIKKRKGCVYRVNPVKNDDGIMITNVTDIRKEWNKYYQKLYTEPRVNDQDEFAKDIDSYLSNVLGGPPLSTELTGGPITVKDTVKQISKMKVKKAPGWDNICGTSKTQWNHHTGINYMAYEWNDFSRNIASTLQTRPYSTDTKSQQRSDGQRY